MRVREDEVKLFIKDLYHVCSDDSVKVEMKSRIQGLSFNIIMRIVANKRFYGTEVEDFEEASKFKDVIRDIFEIGGTTNLGDFIPVLHWIDFQGLDKKFKRLQIKSDNFSQSLIDERRRKRCDSCLDEGKPKTFIDAMLSLQESEPEYYTDDIIKGNILTLPLAGTDTSAVTIEWAISLLLNHPGVLKKARAQIDEYVGHERMVEETDLPNLPYIQCIINETLRLFPAAPLSVPHEPSQDCTIGGFHVSRGTMLERFEKVENEGYRFIPFGIGRRQCPGSSLANRVVGLALASLIQCFKWERIGEDLVDLSEGKGLTMPKSEPLEAMCKARQRMRDVLKEL
uniref:Isoflavone 2'-hydroxylase-like n=1 Tax=Tanacetum cinerariifolium TaxID=118510 RepID=A0A699GZC3_TANCI|nr:isoflavone 2'-hydroxylase-like [Tanacetum cinerariifolium]